MKYCGCPNVEVIGNTRDTTEPVNAPPPEPGKGGEKA
jgi:hypothetical protein